MQGLLDAQRRTLDAWQTACEGQPALHAHQLLALQRERALCAAAGDIDDYLQRSDGAFELCRAMWLDRVAGRLQAARCVDDVWAARAALVEYRAALDAPDAARWTLALTTAAAKTAPWRQRAAEAACGLGRTLQHLLLHHTSRPGMADHRGNALAAWQVWCLADPQACHALWHGRPLPQRVALRLPWARLPTALQGELRQLPEPPAEAEATDADPWSQAHEAQAAWQRRLPHAAACRADRPPLPDALASASQALQPWQMLAHPAADASAESRAVARVARDILGRTAGSANGPEVQRRLIESGLLAALAAAPIRVQLDAIEARQSVWPQPLLVAHATGLRRMLAQARNDTEVEWLAAQAEACLAVECDWQSLLFGVALAPLGASLMGLVLQSMTPSQQDVPAEPAARRAAALAQESLGVDAQSALQLPWMKDFVTRNLVRGLAPDGGTPVARHGEAGHDLLPLLRAWRELSRAHGQPAAADVNGLLPALHRLLQPDGAAAAPQRTEMLCLWRRAAPVEQAGQLLSAPERPALPGWVGKGPSPCVL